MVELKEGMLVVLLVNLDINAGLVNGSQGKIVGFEKYSPEQLPKAVSTLRRAAGKTNKREEFIVPLDVKTLNGEYAALREVQIQNSIAAAKIKEWPVVRFSNGITLPPNAESTRWGTKNRTVSSCEHRFLSSRLGR